MLSTLRKYWRVPLLLLVVFCTSLISFIRLQTFEDHSISKMQSVYSNQDWKVVDAKVLDIGNAEGNYLPERQTATLQYDDTATENQQEVEQSVGLGYHVGDMVTLYVNKSGETIVKDTPNIPNPSPPSRDELRRKFEKTNVGSLVCIGYTISGFVIFLYLAFFSLNIFALAVEKANTFSLI